LPHHLYETKKITEAGYHTSDRFSRRGISTTADVHRSQTQTPPDVILSAGSVLLCKTESSEGYMHSRRYYYVYIMTNRSRTLYTGITSNLSKRVFQHKTGAFPGFTSRYRIDRLVYYERFICVGTAIEREKQIKGLLRIKKLALIVSMNPEWKDLSEGWYNQYCPEKCQDKRIDPSPSASPREASGSG